MPRTTQAKVRKAVLRVEKVLVVDELTTTKAGGVKKQIAVPVSVFREKRFLDKKGKQISARHVNRAFNAIAELYAGSLESLANSYKHPNLPEAKLRWPSGAKKGRGLRRGGKRGKPQSVIFRTKNPAGTIPDDDTPASLNSYTSSTLETYRYRYGYKILGYSVNRRGRTGAIEKNARDKAAKYRMAGVKKFHSLTGPTQREIPRALGSFKAYPGAQELTKSLAQVKAARLNHKAQYRPVKKGKFGPKHRGGAPIHVVTGTLTGFEKAVQIFPAGAQIFALPFAEGTLDTERSDISITNLKDKLNDEGGASRARALLALNEARRPYIRRFMRNQHNQIRAYVQERLRLVK